MHESISVNMKTHGYLHGHMIYMHEYIPTYTSIDIKLYKSLLIPKKQTSTVQDKGRTR